MTKKANEINVKNIMQEYQNTLANLSKTLDVMARMIGTITESETEHPAEESKMLAGSIPSNIVEFVPDALRRSNRTSKYLGVSYDRFGNRWTAQCSIGGKKWLRSFKTEIEAKRAYEAEKARRLAERSAKVKSVYAVSPDMKMTQFDILKGKPEPANDTQGCPLLNANACGVIAGYSPTVWIKWVQDVLAEQAKGAEQHTLDLVVGSVNAVMGVNIKNRLYWKQQKALRANAHPTMVGKMTVLNVLAEDQFRYEATKVLFELLGLTEAKTASDGKKKATRKNSVKKSA